MIGKPGAGVCPVRGHSNVQGDRTMGIFEQMPESFSAALDAEFSISSPRAHGFDTVGAIRAMRDGQARVFVGMGGNFAAAAPDSEVTEAALMRCDLTVHVSTKLNRSHVVGGRTSVILPTLGRSDSDLLNGKRRSVTVEDSMSMVHLSTGRLRPVSDDLRSEPTIVCEIAEALFGPDHPVPWATFACDYDSVRDSISRVIAGFEDFNRRVRSKNGIQLPHLPRDSRTFATDSGKANFVVSELEWVPTPLGRLVLQTMRSHDQYNTTIYGLDDRYRGIKGRRDVVLVNPDDISLLGFTAGDVVDVVSEWRSPDSGELEERRIRGFTLVAYDTPRGNAAAYYPETNPLVPLDHTARGSNTPASKSIVVRLEAT
jgi:molybdopterin-dependent oxidoreductase alpha subunit